MTFGNASPAASPTTAADLRVGQVAWAYARHYWRQVRVVEKARTRVTVVYRLAIGGGIRRQVLQAFNLKTEKPTPRFGVLRTKTVPPPSLEEVGL